MPKSVSCRATPPAKAIHLLGGVSGWGFPYGEKGTVSMIVRLHYDDGKTEDHDAEQRRTLRRLHPPRRCARLEVRVRPATASRCAI